MKEETKQKLDEVKEFDMKVFLAFQNVIHTDTIEEELQTIKTEQIAAVI